MNTGRVFGTAICVLFIEVSSFQGVLIREVPLYDLGITVMLEILVPHL